MLCSTLSVCVCVCAGICDCCDGGDEWWGEVQCENVCAELGRKEEIEQRQHREMQAEGYQKRVQYEQQGIRSVSLPPSVSLTLTRHS